MIVGQVSVVRNLFPWDSLPLPDMNDYAFSPPGSSARGTYFDWACP